MAYERHHWVCGETVTADLLNNIEDGIEQALSGGGGDDTMTVEFGTDDFACGVQNSNKVKQVCQFASEHSQTTTEGSITVTYTDAIKITRNGESAYDMRGTLNEGGWEWTELADVNNYIRLYEEDGALYCGSYE